MNLCRMEAQGSHAPPSSGKSEESEEGKTSTWPRGSVEGEKVTRRRGRGPARSPRGFYEGDGQPGRESECHGESRGAWQTKNSRMRLT